MKEMIQLNLTPDEFSGLTCIASIGVNFALKEKIDFEALNVLKTFHHVKAGAISFQKKLDKLVEEIAEKQLIKGTMIR